MDAKCCKRRVSLCVRPCVCERQAMREGSMCVCVNQCGQMRPKQSCTVKGVNGGGAVRGIGMEIKITWHSDSISVRAAAAEGPLTIQIHTAKLVRRRERERGRGGGGGQHPPPPNPVFTPPPPLLDRGEGRGACETMQINEQISNPLQTSLGDSKSKHK